MEHLDSRSTFNTISVGKTKTLSKIRLAVIQSLLILGVGLFALAASSQSITLDEWENSSNCYICGDEFTSTILDAYGGTDGDIVDFEDPIGDASECITSITLTFNVAAADFNLSNDWSDVDQIDQEYPIELNGYIIGYYDPTELPYICNVCEPNPTVTFNVDSDALPYVYGGTNTFDFNFYQTGDENGTLQDVCVANVGVEFNTTSCDITSDACPMGGYDSNDGRIFWIPGYGTDFAASNAIGLHFEEFSNGTARMHGQIERLSDSNEKFDVDLYFDNKSTYTEWTAMGGEPHSPGLGDETTWTYYSFDAGESNTLTGQGDLAGVVLYLEDSDDNYGLQYGDGANALNSNDDGISTWFSYTGTSSGSGDINGTLLCGMMPCDITVESMDEDNTCGNCDGATWVFVSGGSGNYTYELDGGDVPSYNIPYDGQIDIYDLCSGSYTLNVTDDSGCSEDYTFVIEGECLEPPTSPTCELGSFLWENTIDVNDLNGGAGIPTVDVRLVDGNITQYEIPGTLPAAFAGSVNVEVAEAVSWDAYLTRASTGNQPNEQWKIVFLNGGSVVYETPYTGDLATGVQSDEWVGPLGGTVNLPNGADQILIVHYEDDDYGSGSSSSANSVVPVSVCISYEPACDNVTDGGLIGYNQEGCAPFDPVMIESIVDPSGGTGELEYVWLVSTDGGNNYDVIPGADQSTYNPGILSEDTWFRRCARRAGCDEFIGESNWIFIEITGNCPDGPCEESLVSYGGDCEDGPDSFIPISSESCLSNITDLVPIGGNSSASCDDEIICVASWNNPGWVFSFEANQGVTVEGIVADLLYPIELSTAGGSANHDDCATNFDYHVEFYKNGSLVESIAGDIPADIIVSETISLSSTLYLAAGDEFEVKIIGDPTSSDCDLFENAGTVVIGCCGGDPCEGVDITAVRIYDQATDAPATGIDPIVDGSVINLSDLPANYYLAIEVTDQTESVIIQVNGVNQSIENVIPYTFPNGNENWNAGIGEYIVHAEAYSQDGAMGDLCDEIDLTFIITEDCEIECPDDLILDCTASTDPEYTGYPTLTCGGDTDCARDYGDFDFIFEGFGGDVGNWSFGQGWTTGDGCDPQCGSFPNAFIDFGEFYSDYDRSLTSEVFDGCCTDVVYISYCLRHDLYASGNPPTGHLDVEVSVDGGEWVSFMQYETQNGSTIDWTENNIAVPGAPNSSFQIRFRATGEGYDYTLGGWGLDNVLITGWTNGCDPLPIEVDVDWTYDDSSAGTCPEVVTRTWSGVYDGETITCVQTITLEDNDAPDFSQVPENMTIECGTTAEVVWPLINDACDDNPDLTYEDQVNGSGCEYSIDRVFTATDNCGNTSSYTQVISVLDTEDPVFDNDLEDLTVDCGGELPPAPDCTATDNCDDDLTYEFNEYYPGFNNVQNCQSSDADHHSLWISQAGILDASDSDWNAVGPGSFEQFADGTAILTGTVANEDDTDQIFSYELHLHLERTYAEWTSIPNGNSPTGFREAKLDAGTSVEINDEYLDWSYYEVNDAENNVLIGAGDYAGITLEISARPADYQFGVQVGERASLQSIGFGLSCWINLEGIIDGQEEELHGDFNLAIAPCVPGETPEFVCADTYVVERVWTATDDCGNTAVQTQTITVTGDDEDPVLVGVPADETVECDNVPDPADVTATDNCDDDVQVDFDEDITDLECGYTITRIWTATDDCEHTVSATQVITVTDTTDPELFGVPADITIECDEEAPDAIVFATDNCDDDLTVSLTSSTTPQDCGWIMTRTWSTVDDCGNEASQSQIVTVLDTTDPTFDNLPDDQTGLCDQEILPADVTASDNCDDDVDVTVEQSTSGTGCDYTITFTYTATDDCGNDVVGSYSVTVLDNTPPVADNDPADIIVECDDIPAPPVVNWTDNCDPNVNTDYFEVNEEVDACLTLRTRIWIGTDNCGNTAQVNQVVSIIDSTSPELFGVPADITVECDEDIPDAIVFATDNCDDDLTVSLSSEMVDQDCGHLMIRTWSTADDCGNPVSESQTVTVLDTTDPYVVTGVDPEVTIECDEDEPTDAPTFDDNCDDDLDITAISGITNVSDCGYDIERAWTATDDCDNSVTVTQVIHVLDTTDPTFDNIPDDTTGLCDQVITPADVTASDNCDDDVEVSVVETQDGEGCDYTITFTYTATDDCGNTATASYDVTVLDDEAPVLHGVPADTTVECDDIPAPDDVTATDNCDDDVVPVLTETTNDLECGYELIRTWTATDDCGNASSDSQTITVIDTQAPQVLFQTPDQTIECDEDVPEVVVTFEDNCDSDLTVVVNNFIVELDCGYEYHKTCTATDDCGNDTYVDVVITVLDTTDPYVVTGVDPEVTIECDEAEPTDAPTFDDNCDDDLDITAISGITNVTDCGYDIERAWTATDDCDNSVTVSQIIHVVDTTDPVITCPADYVVDCDNGSSDPAQSGEATATDNCSDATITFVDGLATDDCPSTFERTWTATDECGNSSSCVQLITIDDSTDPVLTCPSDITVECDESIDPSNTGDATATDDCSVPTVWFEDGESTGSCPYSFERTWYAQDPCGNISSCVQLISVDDTTPPIADGEGQEVTVSCEDDLPELETTFSDNCDENLSVTVVTTLEPWGCLYRHVQTVTATDDCGNSTSVENIIYVIDETDPELHGVPADETIECDEEPTSAIVWASDNCDDELTVALSSETVDQECGYLLIRTWTTVDDCGNEASESQTVTVLDTTDPYVVTGVDPEVTIECDEDEPTDMPTFDDNCDDDLDITAISGISNVGPCGYDIDRSWTATDDCGNSITVSQTIHVVDTTAPELSAMPADVAVDCSEIPDAAVITATDNCDDDVTVDFNEVISEGCPYTITRTWSAADDCGNPVSHTQVITVTDTTDPVLAGVPDDYDSDCGDAPEVPVVTATDDCDTDVPVIYSEVVEGDECPLTIVRTWTATDDCGNSISASQTITIDDEIDPVLVGVPADETVECDNVPAPADVTATDNCDLDPDVTYAQDSIPGDPVMDGAPPCGWTLIRTWTATDLCGNSVEASQTITVVDTTAPDLIGVPADVTVECDDIPAPPVVTAIDNCWDEEMEVVLEENTIPLECGYQLIRTWIAEDNCWNYASDTQVITVVDTTDPELFGVPADTTVECDEDIPNAIVFATDNCDDDLTVALSSQTIPQDCGHLLIRTWSTQDDCGNDVSESQTVTVLDTTDPFVVTGVDPEVTIECDEAEPTDAPVFDDNCDDDLTITAISGITNVSDCGYDIERAWTATDDCDNSITVSQVIHVLDTTSPVLSLLPGDMDVDCSEIPDAAVITATDNCDDDVTVDFNEVMSEGCPYTITRTWSAADDCGNPVSHTQVITVTDTTDPVLAGVPEDYDSDCGDAPQAPVVTASDDCDTDVPVIYSEVVEGDECPLTIVRTWTATDDCGNSTSASQTITIDDEIDPVLVGVPADETVECDSVPGPADVTATDNCDADPDVDFDENIDEGDCEGEYVITRTWTATDLCGNMAEATQTITVVDTTDPILSGVPADETVECDDIPDPAVVTASDNCTTTDIIVTLLEETIDADCGYTLIRYWTAHDACGNTTTESQVLTVVDTTDPVLNGVPATDTTVECDEDTTAPIVTATDNCTPNLEVDFNEDINELECGYEIVRTWSAEDECGNDVSATRTITVVDTTSPILFGVPADIEISCGDDVPDAIVGATDNCDDDLVVALTSNTEFNDCGYVLTRTWSTQDDCGNPVSATQVVTAVDDEDPYVVSGPQDVTVDCEYTGEIVPPVFDDECDDELTIGFDSSEDGDDCEYVITNTWTATDDCGHSVDYVQTITVVDTEDPVITCPADADVSCEDGGTSPADTGVATATDNCGTPTVTFVDSDISGNCPATFERVWTATDACGNSSSCTQLISVSDDEDPVWDDFEVFVSAECDDIDDYAPTAMDNCTVDVTVTLIGELFFSGGCAGTIERTYEAVDGCGNSIQATQLIMLTDDTPPVLSGQDETIESECNLPVLLQAPTVSDNCDDDVDVDYDMTTEPGDCENSWTEIHTWTATDDCENVATRVITVVYDDTTDPVFGELPQDTTAECDNIPPMAEVTATDNCDLDVDIDTDETTNIIDECYYEIIRTWTATDNCGNDVSYTQTITVSDNTDPIVVTSVDPEVTIECDQDEPTDAPTFDDNCDDELEVFAISGITNVSDCGYDIERSWTAVDNCGNSVEVSQVIHVVDTTDPVLSATPADIEVSCDNIPLPADVTATDNCDEDVQVGFTEVFGEGCPYTITRTWTAADDCGNDVSHTQVITVIDNEDPVLVGVPDDITEECGEAPDPNDVTATDNCDNDVDVQFSEVVTGDSCPLTITRTWTATDNCGNTSSDSQTIIIDDETDPVFTSVPADETVECDNVPAPGDVTVTDNCDSDPDVSFNEEIIPGDPVMEDGPPCGWTVIRTWTATDLCGNEATAEQVITVVDTTAPDLVGVPADTTVECTNIPDAPTVTAVDNCWDGEMIVTLEENTIDLDCGYQLIRTWTAEDNCWNYNSETQVITVTDTTDPEVESTPANVTIECTDDLPTDDATFSDNCDNELDVIENDVTVDQECGYYILRTWTATDDCGNSISTTQTINVTDTTDPVLSGVPADMDVECSDIPDPANVTATDNCDDDVQIDYNQEIVEGNCPYEIIRTWTATDNCGNTVSESQTLTVNDTTDPTLVGVPADVTVDCNNIPDPADVTAEDNCGVDLTVTLTEDFIQNDCGYTIVRVWTVHDPCGNTASDSQLIVVVDTEDPVASNEPADASYECDQIIPLDEPTFSDDCDDELSIGFNESSTGDACTQTITRTWTAMDDCGNTAIVTQVITVTDTTDPVLVGVPADTTIECNTDIPDADVTATDNCDTAPTVDMDEQTNDLDCGYEIVRTWTATDDCGNNVSASQTITVTDTTDPVVLGTPVNTTVECDEALPTDEPLFSDNCDLDLDVDLDEQINPLDCEYEIVRTWTATDDCGNSVSTSQTITVTDTTDPVLVGLPADETVECDNIPLAANVSATDNCDDDLTVDFNEMIFMTGCPYTIERTWTVEDDCGNSASYTQTLTVTDTTDPVLIGVPADDTVECDNVPDAAVVTVDDNCDLNIQVLFNEDSQDADCGYVITRTWSATDACGNTASASQVLTVVDTTDPVLSGVPADTIAECDNVPGAATVTASDNCDDELVVDFDENIDPQDCGYIITRTWSTEDDCGNTASESQVITVIDTTDPVISEYPADVTVQCDNVPGPGQISADDNCDDNLDISHVDVTNGPDCNYTIERTWTAEDDCGNTTSVTQIITVIDTTDPVISGVPADETIECGGDIPAAADITATDNCDSAPVTGVSEQTIDGDCGYVIERTYTATDVCGNTAEIVQTITVIDTTDPIILDPPADETVSCDAVTIAPTLTATDNCDDDVEVTFNEVVGDGCPYTITRTWTATDDCGNTSSVTQVITVIDEEDPVWDPFEGFVQVSCDEVDDYILTASDNCDVDVTVTITQELNFSGGCYGTLERTYEAVDNCGNAIIAVQLIQIIDEEAPVLEGVPADVEIDCDGEVPPVADVTATDNCDDDVEITFSEVITNTFCPFEIIRTWTAIDDCGNVTEEVQVISVTVETPDLVSLVSFPNPFNDVFTVQFSVPKGAVVNACIYNLIGQEVHMLHKGTVDAHRLYAYNVNGADWESGTYVIMMQVDDQVYHHKMMVMDK